MIEIQNARSGLDDTISQMKRAHILSRIWSHDHTVWRDDPTEITNRLGWLHLPETMPGRLAEIDQFVDQVRAEGLRDVLLLGMGGSSLAPETFATTFGHAEGYPAVRILDSTHPDAIRGIEKQLDLARTLVLVATKSGTTTETVSLFRYFWNRIAGVVGDAAVPRRFVAITDPGTPLTRIAEKLEFRRVFENDPDLGGRYSALSHFGLVPASLLGIDVAELLHRVQQVSRACTSEEDAEENPAVVLGVFLGLGARAGRDKATLFLSEGISSFGNWVEQLVAESTGKDGAGILPVVGEPIGGPEVYDGDRLFIHLRIDGDTSQDAAVAGLADAGHPVARIDVADRLELGGQFFLWELATAIAAHVLKLNPFDQPNVEAAKRLARQMTTSFAETGGLPECPSSDPTPEALDRLLDQGLTGDYVAIQAYVPSTPHIQAALATLRRALRDRWGFATTLGYGPRFLHSTGQLHKGDSGNGLFLQLVADVLHDLPIPDEPGEEFSTFSFATLIAAEAAGDRTALVEAGRRVATLRLDPARGPKQIRDLAQAVG